MQSISRTHNSTSLHWRLFPITLCTTFFNFYTKFIHINYKHFRSLVSRKEGYYESTKVLRHLKQCPHESVLTTCRLRPFIVHIDLTVYTSIVVYSCLTYACSLYGSVVDSCNAGFFLARSLNAHSWTHCFRSWCGVHQIIELSPN